MSLFNFSRNKLLFIRLFISSVLLYFIILKVDIGLVVNYLKQLSLPLFMIFLLGKLVEIVLISWRWSLWLTPKLTLKKYLLIFRASLIGYYYNLALPGISGGDLFKWLHLSNLKASRKRLVFSVLSDRISGLLMLLLIGSGAFIVISSLKLYPLPDYLNYLIPLLLAAFVFTLVAFSSSQVWRLLPFFRKLARLQALIQSHRRIFFFSLGISFLDHLFFFGLLSVLALAVRFPAQPSSFFLFGPFISLIQALPISWAGFGTTEAAYLFFFTPLGFNRELIISFTLALGLQRLLLALFGWLFSTLTTSWELSNA